MKLPNEYTCSIIGCGKPACVIFEFSNEFAPLCREHAEWSMRLLAEQGITLVDRGNRRHGMIGLDAVTAEMN